ncbi:hypothetical protein ACOMHN_051190 [Nucella lapillus]
MAAPMTRGAEVQSSSSWSESSEDDKTEPDEKLRRLQDAVITADYFADLVKWRNSSGTGNSQVKTNLPSNRRVDVNEHEDENPLRTTPEFRAFVSKKLAEKLDREIEFCVTKPAASEYASWIRQDMTVPQEGVRLFSDSCQDLSNVDEVPPPQPRRPPKPRHRLHTTTPSDGYSCEAERVAAVAVTADFLAEERAMWARLRQASAQSTSTQKQPGVTTAPTAGSETGKVTSSLQAAGKKKKKKKSKDGEKSVGRDSNTASDREQKETDHVKKKKKRKRGKGLVSSKRALDRSTEEKTDSSVENVSSAECEPVKKKKKDSVSSAHALDPSTGKGGDCDVENVNGMEHEPTKKKKKKKKNADNDSRSKTEVDTKHGEHSRKRKKKKHQNVEEAVK